MSIFTILLLFLTLFQFFKLNFKDFFKFLIIECIILKLICDVGMGIDLKIITIRPYELTYYILMLCSLYILVFKTKLSKGQYKLLIFLIIFILCNNFLIIIRPLEYQTVCFPDLWYNFFNKGVYSTPSLNKYVLIYDFYFVMFYLVICSIKNYLSKNEIINLFKRTLKLTFAFLLFIVFLEIIIKLIFGQENFYVIRNYIFGIASDTSSLLNRGGFSTIYGLCTEPSSFALSLFYIALGMLVIITKRRTIMFILLIILILGIFSGSMLFYFLFILIILSFCLKYYEDIKCFINKNNKLFISFIFLFFIVFFIFCNTSLGTYIVERIHNVFNILLNQDILFNSESVRIFSAVNMINVFIQRPLFGAGIGTTYGFSSLFSLLSNVGVIGFILYYLILCDFTKNIKLHKLMYLVLPLLISLMVHGNINSFLFPHAIFLFLLIYTDQKIENTTNYKEAYDDK